MHTTENGCAVEVLDPSARHLSTVDSSTVEAAVGYWLTSRPGADPLAAWSIDYYTDEGTTVGAEVRDPITGALSAQFVRHPAGWAPEQVAA